MSNDLLIGLIANIVLMIFLFLGVPIWLTLGLIGLVGFGMIVGINQALTVAATSAVSVIKDYTFAVLPVFLLMGEFADISGMMNDAYKSANKWLGNLPGGLAMASILGAAAFSAVSGSSMACAAIMTRVALPQLIEYKYHPELATGALAAGGTVGNLIPPGGLLVVYALIAEVSLGKLFIACYIPGFLLTLMYLIQIYIQCKINPSLGPRANISNWKDKLLAFKGMAIVILIMMIILGGIQFGIFTPNEAASVSTVIVIIYALVRRTLTGRNVLEAFKSTAVTTGMCLAILTGAAIFNVFITITGLPQALGEWLTGLNLSALGVIILIMVVYFILGIPLNGITIIVLTLPILLPVLKAYNIDLYWFGVLSITQCELANITPPVGMNLFVVAAMAKPMGISMNTVFRGSYIFCATCMVFVILLIAFPQISTFLVSAMK
jgi:tripartite ATP-independent transporter DctM subunit